MPRIIPIRDLKNTAAVSQMCSESKNLSISPKMAMAIWSL